MSDLVKRKTATAGGGSSNDLQKSLVDSQEKLRHEQQMEHSTKMGVLGLLVGIILGGVLAKVGGEQPSNSMEMKGPGWNPIHVFYGKMNHLYGHDQIPEKWYVKDSPQNSKEGVSKEWFGQHGQDVAVASFLGMKSNGYFVDLASNDAVWASNTFALESNLGWKGICIEANPVYWYRLAFRKNCHVVGSIVGGSDLEEIKVNLPTDARARGPYGGIVGEKFDNKKQDNKNDEPRYTVSLVNLLKKFDAPKVIDYLSLDVEGAEEFIMKEFPFHKPYTFKVITIERPKPLLKEILDKAGYQHVLDFKRGDTLWAHKSVYEEGKKRVEKAGEAITRHAMEDWPRKKNMR